MFGVGVLWQHRSFLAKLTEAVQLKSGASHATSVTLALSLVALSRGARCVAAVISEPMNISMYVVTLVRRGSVGGWEGGWVGVGW